MMTAERLREIVAEHESTTFPESYEDRMLARNTDWEVITATAHYGRGELLAFILELLDEALPAASLLDRLRADLRRRHPEIGAVSIKGAE